MKNKTINLNKLLDKKPDSFWRHIRKNGQLVLNRIFQEIDSDKIYPVDIGVVKRDNHYYQTGRPIQILENGTPFWAILNVQINNTAVDLLYYAGNDKNNTHDTVITIKERIGGKLKITKLVNKKNGKTSAQRINQHFDNNDQVIQEYLELLEKTEEQARVEAEKEANKKIKTKPTEESLGKEMLAMVGN